MPRQLKLKPCPFCGEVPIMSNGYVGETSQTSALYSHTFICCNNPECYIKPETMAETMEEAAEKWNIRRRGKSNEDKMERT